MSTPVLLTAILIVAALLVVLATRAWRLHQPVLRWIGTALAGLVALVGLLIAGVGFLGVYRLNAPQGVPAPSLTVAASPEQIARGEHLANICANCHSPNGDVPLSGGSASFLGPLGTLFPPNLTPGGPLRDWSDGEIERAIRIGVDRNAHPLLVMPSQNFHGLSDADAQSLIAYLRSQPAVDHPTPEKSVNLLGVLLIGTGQLPVRAEPPIIGTVQAPPAGITPEYGNYLVTISGCNFCHGDRLTGGAAGGFNPVGPNIVFFASQWTPDQFVQTFRAGTDPYGHQINDQMPWQQFSRAFSDDELRAMHAYLKSLS